LKIKKSKLPKSNAERCREYRARQKVKQQCQLTNVTPTISRKTQQGASTDTSNHVFNEHNYNTNLVFYRLND